MESNNSQALKQLLDPLPYKWRVQSFSKSFPSATCIAYVDSRLIQNRLDEVMGAENWQTEFYGVNGLTFCRLSIRINGEWIHKSDCGSESDIEKEKGLASDAFKRGAVHFGIGRFLYDLGVQYVKASDIKSGNNLPYCIDEQGNKIKDLTKFLNGDKNSVFQGNSANTQSKNNISKILESLKACTTLDELRVVREKNKSLENSNAEYKKALSATFIKMRNKFIKLLEECE